MENTDGKRNFESWSETRRCLQPKKMAEGSKEDGHEVCGHLGSRGNITSKRWMMIVQVMYVQVVEALSHIFNHS